jgi:hypothetical protein
VFPLLELGGQQSPYVVGIGDDLRRAGYHVSIEEVPYEFRRGANQMMRIRP